jgi:nitric oxide reductase NorD protein
VCLIADALPAEADCISVAAFHSNTRHQCAYQELKGFGDSWSHLKKELTVLEPSGYTRIGPALRHGLELYKSASVRHKFIILLSDGKASDFDHYEGQYGMEDIKQALREARQQNIHIKCLAIEENAKFYLPQMFGSANIHILSNPHKLPQALSSLLLPLL